MNEKEIVKTKNSKSDLIFDIVVNILVAIAAFVTLYPMYFVVLASVSEPAALLGGDVFFYPVKPDLSAYVYIFKDTRIIRGYMNTAMYTFFGTMIGVFVTIPGAYALSRKDLLGRNIIMKLMVFTMYFQGGLIPTYIVIKAINLTDTRLLMMILGSFTVFNIIISRTFFVQKIPEVLREASQIDGCGNGRFFFKIVLPLSKEIVAVMVLYIAVYHWNSFFNALIFLSNQKLYPLQLILREILLGTQSIMGETVETDAIGEMQRLAETIKFGVMVVSTLPILMLYPFIQRYFIYGVMIGSIKG